MPRMPAKRAQVLSRDLSSETIVFDQRTNAAHALDMTASAVWNACDPRLTIAEVATQLDLTVTQVEASLQNLRDADLLAADGGHTRRRVLQGAGVAGVGLVVSIAVPTAAAAGTNGSMTSFTGAATPGSTYQSSPGSTLTIYTVPFTTTADNQSITLTGDPVLEFSDDNPNVVKSSQVQVTLDEVQIVASEDFPDDRDSDDGTQYSYSLGTGVTTADFNQTDDPATTSVATAGPHTIAVTIYDGSNSQSEGNPDQFVVSQGSLTVTVS